MNGGAASRTRLSKPCPRRGSVEARGGLGGLQVVVAGAGGVLVARAPGGAAQAVGGVGGRRGDQGGGRGGELVAGQRDHSGWRRLGVLGQRGHGEEGQREHGQGDPPV